MNNSHSLPKVLVPHLPEGWLAPLKGRCHAISHPAGKPVPAIESGKDLSDAVGILTLLTNPVGEKLLAQLPGLKVVSNMAVGLDNIDLQACTRRGIVVGHTPGVLTEATADMALALLLSTARRLPESSTDARQGRWTTWTPDGWLGKDLNGATLGIIGMGKIGRAIADRAAPFGLEIVYTSRTPKPGVEQALGAVYLPFGDLLQRSDFVVLAVDLNPDTRGMIDQYALETMKNDAVLVNISRGPVVQTPALLRALQEGWIAAAALDVTDPEPLPSDHQLYSLPNCLITPHIASATEGTRRKMAELACQNLLAGIRGERLPHCANPEVYS